MNNQKEKTSGEVFDQILAFNQVISQSRDNLFSANARSQMVRNYGYTQAQTVTINDLI